MRPQKAWKLWKLFGNSPSKETFWKLLETCYSFCRRETEVSSKFPQVSTSQSFQFPPFRGDWETPGNYKILASKKAELFHAIKGGDDSNKTLKEYVTNSRLAAQIHESTDKFFMWVK
jgi:hypothetical protein